MEITIHNQDGAKNGTIAVSSRVFGARMNADLVWQVATSQMANQRQVLAHTKTRSEVRGGGKKPWKQKGTGHARHGSIRSPIWIGGGVAHGPSKEVIFKKTITKSAARSALAVTLSDRALNGNLLVLESLAIDGGKTKTAVKVISGITKQLKGYKPGARILLVLGGTVDDLPIRRAVNNLSAVTAVRAQDLSALTVLSYPHVVATKDALTMIERTLAKKTAN